jgi:F-type H+-transporting ATPase subunit b
MNVVTQFASESASGGVLGALGIDWRMLIFQIIGFAILVVLMGKYVFPVLNKSIEKREAAIRESADLADKARQDALAAEAKIAKDLEAARKQAQETIEIAHKEAVAMVEDAEKKAVKRADHIIAQAEARLVQETTKAREALRHDATELVALATGKVLSEKVDASKDAGLIKKALDKAQEAK